MVERAYKDIIIFEIYSYRRLVGIVDVEIYNRIKVLYFQGSSGVFNASNRVTKKPL